MRDVTNLDKVKNFHQAFGLAINQEVDRPLVALREKLLTEEYKEAVEEINLLFDDVKRSKAPLAKELADLLYVTYGCAISFGINLDLVFNEVHRSNMSKLGEDGKPIYRKDGKVLKGPSYSPANLQGLV